MYVQCTSRLNILILNYKIFNTFVLADTDKPDNNATLNLTITVLDVLKVKRVKKIFFVKTNLFKPTLILLKEPNNFPFFRKIAQIFCHNKIINFD